MEVVEIEPCDAIVRQAHVGNTAAIGRYGYVVVEHVRRFGSRINSRTDELCRSLFIGY